MRQLPLPNAFARPPRRLAGERGNVLIYVIMTMLIFAALGVSMVSLFTATSSSTAPPNQARRALYLKESGLRYAVSELRNTGFDDDVLEALNTTTFDLQQESSFTLNIFSLWFESANYQDLNGGTLSLRVPHGTIPDGFTIPANVWVVNFNYMDVTSTRARDQISGWSKTSDTTLNVSLTGDFEIGEDDGVCLSVQPTETQTINDGQNLFVEPEARFFFPLENGAINIQRIDCVYQKLTYDSTNNRVVLENVSWASMPNSENPPSLTVNRTPPSGTYTGDFILLSNRNYIVIPTGTSGTVSAGGALEDSLYIADYSTVNPMYSRADIDEEEFTSNISKKETTSGVIGVNTTDDTIDVGGGTSRVDTEFGAAWYGGDLTLGGSTNFCQAGACRFGRGIRAFFLLKYSGSGEGLTFSLLNGALNVSGSVGGDKDMPELLAYAGDSRLNSGGTSFLDNVGRGLRAPKMSMELDARPNNTKFTYCSGASSSQFNTDTRNDPEWGTERDAVQYVFWGFNDSLDVPCRPNGNPVTYDDNRHDTTKGLLQWESELTGNRIRSTPTVGPDGTIYVGSNVGQLFAFNPDGTIKWTSNLVGAVQSSPVVGSIGSTAVVYFGSDDGRVYCVNAETGAQIHSSINLGAAVRGSPVIGAGGEVYVGAENSKFYGFSSNLTQLWDYTLTWNPSFGRPPVSSSSGIVYVSSRASSGNYVWAINPATRKQSSPPAFPHAASGEWQYPIGDANDRMPGRDPNTENILSDAAGNKIVAINKDGGLDWEWFFGDDFDSTPVVGRNGTIYFGADDGKLYAINPADRKSGLSFPNTTEQEPYREWSFLTGGEIDTTPAITPDGTIVVVSRDGNLYAVNRDGTLKWSYPVPSFALNDRPNSSPAVGNSGVVYVGGAIPDPTINGRLYAIPDFPIPRNHFDRLITSTNDGKVAGQSVSLNSIENWFQGDNSKPWAVRMEVDRSISPNVGGKYNYVLRSWIRQCSSTATPCDNVLNSFFEDTRVAYSVKAAHLEQAFELDATQHDNFTRFLFGFTGSVAAGDDQSALISNFKLSFIRFNDPEITSDPKWP